MLRVVCRGTSLAGVAGDAAEAVVDLQQLAVVQAGDQQAIRRGVEGLGELLLGQSQLLLGALSSVMSRTDHDQRRRGRRARCAGRDQAGELICRCAG